MMQHSTRISADQESVNTIGEAGFQATEIRIDEATLTNWQAAAALFGETANTVQFPVRLEMADEELRSFSEFCKAVKATVVTIHQPMMEKWGDRLAELLPETPLAVENGPMSLARLVAWADKNDHLTLDIEHFWKFSMNDCPMADMLPHLANFVAAHSAKLRQVHVCGYKPGEDVHRPMHMNRDVSLAVLQILADNQFSGQIVSEVSDEYMCHRELAMDVSLVESWIKDHQTVSV